MSGSVISQSSVLARDRFFAIDELVSLFLHQADILVLMNCQRVSRLWKDIIDQSRQIQESLFLTPTSSESDEVTLNPVLTSHFGPLFFCRRSRLESGKIALRSAEIRYSDLETMPWARDGIDFNAPARQAFARKEASWRRMLVSQPPISRLSWRHVWESETLNQAGMPILCGSGDQYYYDAITIGMLWDWLEPLLLRECSVWVLIYPMGCSPDDDPLSTDLERPARGMREAKVNAHTPRIRVLSTQDWPGGSPSVYQKFDVQNRRWIILDEYPEPLSKEERRRQQTAEGNGFHWLHDDCKNDWKDENWRWSRSDGFKTVGFPSGGSGFIRAALP